MKRTTLLLLTLLTLLCGCEKVDLQEVLNGGNEKGHKTTFSFSLYTINDFDEASTRAVRPLSDVASVLNVAIYKEDGTRLSSINQKATDEKFGTISLNLPSGNYKVVALAHNCSGNATTTKIEKITFPDNKVTDTFFVSYDIQVNSSRNYDLTLKRCVAKFCLHIEQEIPAEVKQMKFYYTGGSSTIDGETGMGCVSSRQTEYRDVTSHAAGQEFSIYTFPRETESQLAITITALDDNGNVYAEKTLSDVPIVLRKYTTCRDKFFTAGGTGSQSGSFSFMVNDEWEGEITLQ